MSSFIIEMSLFVIFELQEVEKIVDFLKKLTKNQLFNGFELK